MSIYDTGGNNRKVSYPAAADWDNLAQGTVCGWVRPDDVNNLARSLWAKNPSGWVVQRSGADGSKISGSVARATTAQSVTTATGTLLAGTWQFVAFTWDITNGGPRLYVGGLSAAAVDVSVSAVDGSGAKSDDSANVVTIGNAATNSNSFPGRHANVMIFARDLALTELLAIQFSGRPVVADGSLRLWAPLYSIGHLEDVSGAHRTGTNTTMVTRQHVPLGWAEYPGFQALRGPGGGLTATSTDTATVTDAATSVTAASTTTDSHSVSETLSIDLTYGNQTEITTVSDAAATNAAMQVTDSLTVSESASAQSGGQSGTGSDTGTVSETAGVTIAVTAVDSVTISEVLSNIVDAFATEAITESEAVAITAAVLAVESGTITEAGAAVLFAFTGVVQGLAGLLARIPGTVAVPAARLQGSMTPTPRLSGDPDLG